EPLTPPHEVRVGEDGEPAQPQQRGRGPDERQRAAVAAQGSVAHGPVDTPSARTDTRLPRGAGSVADAVLVQPRAGVDRPAARGLDLDVQVRAGGPAPVADL